MSVDRSLLPPLPGKPDWYVENAPTAAHDGPTSPRPAPLVLSGQQGEPPLASRLLPESSPLAAPAFATAATAAATATSADAHQGRALRKFKALLHK